MIAVGGSNVSGEEVEEEHVRVAPGRQVAVLVAEPQAPAVRLLKAFTIHHGVSHGAALGCARGLPPARNSRTRRRPRRQPLRCRPYRGIADPAGDPSRYDAACRDHDVLPGDRVAAPPLAARLDHELRNPGIEERPAVWSSRVQTRCSSSRSSHTSARVRCRPRSFEVAGQVQAQSGFVHRRSPARRRGAVVSGSSASPFETRLPGPAFPNTKRGGPGDSLPPAAIPRP